MRRELWVASFVDDMMKQPDRLIFLVEASNNPQRAETWRGYDKFAIQAPRDLTQDVGGGLGFAYNLWKEYGLSSDREQAKERIRNYYNRNPGEFYDFAQRAFDSLDKPDSQQSIVEKEFTRLVKEEYEKGGIVPHDAAMTVLVNHAPTSTVVAPILQELKNQSASDLKEILSSDANLRKFIESRFGRLETYIDSKLKSLEISNGEMRDLVKQIVEETAQRRSSEQQREQLESKARDMRAGVFIVSGLLGLADPQGAAFISTVGNAGVDTYTALSDVAVNGMTIASAATLVGAGLVVAQLFMKNADPAAERHKQLVQMLQAIAEDIKEIRRQLGRMEVRLIELSEKLTELREGQIGSAQLTLQAIQSLQQEIIGVWAKLRLDNQEQLQQSFRDSVVECFNSYPSRRVFVTEPLSTEGAPLRTCLTKSQTFGLLDSKGSTFTGNSNQLTRESLVSMLDKPFDNLGMLPKAVASLGNPTILVDRYAVPAFDGADLASIVNPMAWASGASAFVELRMLVPEFRWSEEPKIIAQFLAEGRRAKRALSIINSLRSGEGAVVTSRPNIKGRQYRFATARAFRDLELLRDQFLRKKTDDKDLGLGLQLKYFPVLEKTPSLSLLDFELLGFAFRFFDWKYSNWRDAGQVVPSFGYDGYWKGCFNFTSDMVWHESQRHRPDYGQVLHRYVHDQWCGEIKGHLRRVGSSLEEEPDLKKAVDEAFSRFQSERGRFRTRDLVAEANEYRAENDAWGTRYLTIMPDLENALDRLRQDFSLYVSAQLVTNKADKLSEDLDQIDLGLYSWEFLERIGGADCFWANPTLVSLFYGKERLLSGLDLRKAAERGVNFVKSGIVDSLRYNGGTVSQTNSSGETLQVSRIAVADDFGKSSKTCSALPKVFEQAMNKLTEYEAFLTRAPVP